MGAPLMFGLGHCEVPDELAQKVDAIARRHGATFVRVHLPEGWRYWFEARDVGESFNAATKADVLDDLVREGIALP